MNKEDRQLLEEAMGLLEYPAGMDHWCDDDECAIDNPRCSDMHMRAALEKLETLADPKMKTIHPSRLTNLAERIFFEEWCKENVRQSHLNHGFTTLEHILDPSIESHRNSDSRRPLPPRPSQRDADVATTLIQWLGTNCGRGFIERCERRIERESAERANWWRQYPFLSQLPSNDEFARKTASRIVGDNVPAGDCRESIRERLTSAIALHLQAFMALYATGS